MSFLGFGLLVLGGFGILNLLIQDRELKTRVEVDPYFPTLDITGWGVDSNLTPSPDFPSSFKISEHTFRPYLKEGRIKGWWVRDDALGGEEFYDDSLLEDQFGESHIKISKRVGVEP
jgi:hypothetical protein